VVPASEDNQSEDSSFDDDPIYLKLLECIEYGLKWEAFDILMDATKYSKPEDFKE